MIQEKLDLKKVQKELFKVKEKEYKKVLCPMAKYIAIDGAGNPNNNPEYQSIVGALYKMAYSIKMEYKKRGLDFVVMPLAGQWWADDMNAFKEKTKDKWKWTMMIQVPDYVEENDIEFFRRKFQDEEVGQYLNRLYSIDMDERLVFATLYIGAYRDEAETIKNLHDTIINNGYRLHENHMEIYISDPRRVEESRLKTIILQPAIEIEK